jgi:hypothetical protein
MRKLMTKINNYEVMLVAALAACVVTFAAVWMNAFYG